MNIHIYPAIQASHKEFNLLEPLMESKKILEICKNNNTVCDVGRIKLDDKSELSVYSPNYQDSLPLPFKEDA